MGRHLVVNASPLILLGKVQLLDLLPNLAEELVVPAAVMLEIERGPAHDPARQWLGSAGSKFILPDRSAPTEIANWDLGSGETAVLAWAFAKRNFEAVLDDSAARKCATVYQIPVRGTLGIIIAARKENLIPAAKPVFGKLIEAGLLIDESLVRNVLQLVGE